MKKMKLFCGILIGLLVFTSCSSDDDASTVEELIIGTWKPVKEVDVCSTGNEDTYILDDCEQTSRITFASSGTINVIENYLFNDICEEDFNATGTWVLIDGNLTVSIEGDVSSPTFLEIYDNLLRVGFYDADPNNPCDGGNLPSHYYIEYERAQ